MSRLMTRLLGLVPLMVAAHANADSLVNWAVTSTEIATDGPNTTRTMALVQNAVYEAVNAITGKYPRSRVDLGAPAGASLDAAIAAASRSVLLHEAPLLSSQTDAAYKKAIAMLAEDAASKRGIEIGEKAAADVVSKHASDIPKIEPYRPITTPGSYVPTTFPLGYAVAQHQPWFLSSPSQILPPPPPALEGAVWAHDYNETKTLGAVNSSVRTSEQTEIARFWATALPEIHMGVIHSLARAPGREITRNARLYAAATAAVNDAEIAVLNAKYRYSFWRPITAIRNGDRDNNSATDRDPDWTPMIATPMHPEYPCGHCIIAATIACIIRADVGKEPLPTLSTTSNTARGVTRSWKRTEDVVAEVIDARIYDGVHYRTSGTVAKKMGEQVGAIVSVAYGLPGAPGSPE
jgi:hypothetical protein